MRRPHVYERSAPRGARGAYQEGAADPIVAIVPDVDMLRVLLARVEAASEPDGMLDRDLLSALHLQGHDIASAGAARPTGSLDAAVGLISRVLPGWAWSCGTCVVSNDGRVKPDVDGPDAHLCDRFDEGFFGDAKGGNVRLSLIHGMLQGLIAKATANGEPGVRLSKST